MTERTEGTTPAHDALQLAAALRAVVGAYLRPQQFTIEQRAKAQAEAAFSAGFALGAHNRNKSLYPELYKEEGN